MDSHDIILGPIITEKSMKDASKGKYVFKVAVKANKKEIRKTIEEKFKVNVLNISTITVKGRTAKAGVRRIEQAKSNYKKAIVTVKAGQKIAIFDASS